MNIEIKTLQKINNLMKKNPNLEMSEILDILDIKIDENNELITDSETINDNVCEAEIIADDEINTITDRNIMKMSNQLIEAKLDLKTSEEMKIFGIIVAQIDTNDKNFKTYEVNIKDLEKITNKKKNEKQLKDLADRMLKKTIYIIDQKGWTGYTLFNKIKYIRDEAKFQISFHPDLKPFLLDLKANFTKANLLNYVSLNSSYAMRIYLFLKQFEKIGKRKFEVDKLREILKTPKSYSNFKDFKKYVLQQAEKEINEKTDLKVKYEITKRVRRKVVEIEFSIRKNESVAKALETKKIEAQANREAKYKDKKECYSIKKEVATTVPTQTQTQKIYEAEIIETTQNNIIKNDDVIDNNTIKKTFKFIKNFKDFREFLTNDLNEYYFIINDDIYTLVANLLCKNNQKLTSSEALESWNLLFKNRNSDKLKVYDEAEYKNYLQLQAEKKQKLDDYMNKAIEFIKNKTYKIIDLNDIEKEYKVTNVEIVEATFTKQIVTVYLQNNYFENFTFTANVKNATNNDKIKLIMKDDKLAMMFVR